MYVRLITALFCACVGCVAPHPAVDARASALRLDIRDRRSERGELWVDYAIGNKGNRVALVDSDLVISFTFRSSASGHNGVTYVSKGLEAALPIQRKYIMLPPPRRSRKWGVGAPRRRNN